MNDFIREMSWTAPRCVVASILLYALGSRGWAASAAAGVMVALWYRARTRSF